MAETFRRERPEEQLEFTGERLTGAATGQVEIEHLHRYFLARDLGRGRDVLDIASGEGYGAAILAQVARSVIGVDISEQTVRFAARNYRKDNLSFRVGDARNIPLPDAAVDVVVSFETIEHLSEHEQFLSEIKRVLRPGGLLVMSSPDRDVYSSGGDTANPFHVRELTAAEFTALLSRHFTHVAASGQRCFLGSALLPLQGEPAGVRSFERRSEALVEGADGPARAVYIFAQASDNPIEGAATSIYVHSSDVDGPARRIAAMHAELQQARAALAAADDRLAALGPDESGVAALRARIAQRAEAAARAPSSAGVERTGPLPYQMQDGDVSAPQGGAAAGVQQPLSEAESGREAADAPACANQGASETLSEANAGGRRFCRIGRPAQVELQVRALNGPGHDLSGTFPPSACHAIQWGRRGDVTRGRWCGCKLQS
jgi:SAM-dependent methyltransferase